jgi:hypothetical protein
VIFVTKSSGQIQKSPRWAISLYDAAAQMKTGQVSTFARLRFAFAGMMNVL